MKKLKVGDRVKLISRRIRDAHAIGSMLEIKKDDDGDLPYYCSDNIDDNDNDWYAEEQLELVESKKTNMKYNLKVGDKLRMKYNNDFQKKNDIVTIIQLDDRIDHGYDGNMPYEVQGSTGKISWPEIESMVPIEKSKLLGYKIIKPFPGQPPGLNDEHLKSRGGNSHFDEGSGYANQFDAGNFPEFFEPVYEEEPKEVNLILGAGGERNITVNKDGVLVKNCYGCWISIPIQDIKHLLNLPNTLGPYVGKIMSYEVEESLFMREDFNKVLKAYEDLNNS